MVPSSAPTSVWWEHDFDTASTAFVGHPYLFGGTQSDHQYVEGVSSTTAYGKYGGFTNPYNEEVWEYNIALAEEAVNVMQSSKITCLFVVDPEGSRKVAGILHIHDCLRAGVV